MDWLVTTANRPTSGDDSQVLDALPAEVAVLDDAGVIVAVNSAWRRFGGENGATAHVQRGDGLDYLAECDRAAAGGDASARAAAEAIRAVLGGALDRAALEYRCDAPERARWFEMRVAPFGPGAVVLHVEVTARKAAESTRAEQARLEGAVMTGRTVAHELGNALALVQVYADLLRRERGDGASGLLGSIDQVVADASAVLSRLQRITRFAETDLGGGPMLDLTAAQGDGAPTVP